jgi:hypothetical protein
MGAIDQNAMNAVDNAISISFGLGAEQTSNISAS